MNINQLYGGNYLKADDLGGKARTVSIISQEPREFDDGKAKLVLGFKGTDKTLVLNQTNAKMIAAQYGNDSENWVGKAIELRPEKVFFGGNMVNAIRVYIPQAAASQAFQQPPQDAATTDAFNDDIDF